MSPAFKRGVMTGATMFVLMMTAIAILPDETPLLTQAVIAACCAAIGRFLGNKVALNA